MVVAVIGTVGLKGWTERTDCPRGDGRVVIGPGTSAVDPRQLTCSAVTARSGRTNAVHGSSGLLDAFGVRERLMN